MSRKFPLAVLLLAAPLAAQSTTRINLAPGGGQALGNAFRPTLSADGRYVAFDSQAANLVAGDTNGVADIFVRDLVAGTTALVSVDSAGVQGNALSYFACLSADGQHVAFISAATNLVPGDSNGTTDVFVRDLASGQTTRASVGPGGVEAADFSQVYSISTDGRFVGFYSYAANLVAGDSNGRIDVFVRDRLGGLTVRASLSNGGAQANADCYGGGVSADGRYVGFYSAATNLVAGDTNGTDDMFVRDLVAGTTIRVSVDSAGAQGNGNSGGFILTPDGRYALFSSLASNLVPNDTNAAGDLFLRDLWLGQTTRVSLSTSGGQADGGSGGNEISGDGRYVVFSSTATNLAAGDTNGTLDVYVRDRTTSQTWRASVDTAGAGGNSYSYSAAISGDGGRVVFQSGATNLVPGDTNGFDDIFLRERAALAASATCFGDGTQPTPCPCANSGAAGRGCENSAATGGAHLALSGFGEPDSAVLLATGLVAGALAIFLQGDAELGPGVPFGDGVRCAAGALKRLYAKTALAGAASAPETGDAPLGMRSSQLGDGIAPGTSRWYQVWYRDADAGFCPAPAGAQWNVSNGVRADW